MTFNLVSQQKPTDPLPVTQSNELAAVITQYLSNFLSERTREAYESDFKDFGNFIAKNFGPIGHPKDITKTHVIAYRDYLREKYSPTSINRKMSALSSLFRELQGARIVDINRVPPANLREKSFLI